jgi:predicted nucleic acid-binding protein
MIFFDTTYLVRLYLDDRGHESVRELATQNRITSSWHGQAEIFCTLHRAFREKRLNAEEYQSQREQVQWDRQAEAYLWFPLTDSILSRVDHVLAAAPATIFLRAADALHLACAAENGFTEVYSNDRYFLAAAPLFGLHGVNVIPAV